MYILVICVIMDKELREYILKELRFTTHPKYYKYLDEYINSIDDYHLQYWKAWSEGKMSIYS